MTIMDTVMLIASFLVVGFVLTLSQRLHKAGYSLLFTRKLVHVTVGLWIIPTMLFFDHAWVAAIPSVVAIIGNTLSYYTGLIGSIEMKHDRANYGTIFYPASFVVIILAFFPQYNTYWYAGMLGILIMAFGDTAASVYGRFYGHRKYEVWDETRSIEGSLAMFFVTLVLAWLMFGVAGLYSITGLTGWGNFILAGYVAAFSTIVEAASIRGWDNFLVPVGSAFFTLWMLKLFVV